MNKDAFGQISLEVFFLNHSAIILGIVISSVAASVPAGTEQISPPMEIVVPTHADAAFIIAKYSGLFDRYVSPDASLNECVSFLNDHGIYFGLLEVVSGKEFTRVDCARVMGQIRLLFSGEAEFLSGKVKLPKDVDSWQSFCIMDDVKFLEAYEAIQNAVRAANYIDR